MVQHVCIECGCRSSQALYREYKGGSIQLSQCSNCERFLDKYVEYDAVILMLDILLLRIQSYRHIIFNYDITSSLLWRLSVVLVLCEAYLKMRLQQLTTEDFILLQLHFHLALLHGIVEFFLIMFMSYFVLVVFRGEEMMISWNHMLRVIILSSYVKFCAVVAMIWVDEFYIHFLLFLSLPAQLQAYRALLSGHWFQSSVLVFIQTAIIIVFNRITNVYRLTLFEKLKHLN